jgi:hypothetical protein
VKRRNREEWLRDVQARQRNIVFPDTAANEARFWRNLYTGRQKLTTLQTIGVAVMLLAVIAVVIGITFGYAYDAYTSWAQRIASAALEWAFGLGLLGGFLLLLKWGTREK